LTRFTGSGSFLEEKGIREDCGQVSNRRGLRAKRRKGAGGDDRGKEFRQMQGTVMVRKGNEMWGRNLKKREVRLEKHSAPTERIVSHRWGGDVYSEVGQKSVRGDGFHKVVVNQKWEGGGNVERKRHRV